ncbi:MAG: HD domain-containing protein [Oligoflexia bacterium]|nr:HD domain-containing protein [Oligoflexia bacterium]
MNSELNFIFELDKLKSIYRQTILIDESRNENSAEHSWHLAMAVLLFSSYLNKNKNFDKLRAVKMALVHDIVEIDAGDTIVYGDNSKKEEKEALAAERIFSISDSAKEFKDIWIEFEERKCIESQFVSAIDRLLPILINLKTKGHTWKKHNIAYSQVVAYNKPKIEQGFPEIWPEIDRLLLEAKDKGFLI